MVIIVSFFQGTGSTVDLRQVGTLPGCCHQAGHDFGCDHKSQQQPTGQNCPKPLPNFLILDAIEPEQLQQLAWYDNGHIVRFYIVAR